MKVLYLIHICWEWIFQRPQILELFIQEDFDCTVISKKFIFGKRLAKNNITPKKMIKAYQLPGSRKISFIQDINNILYKLYLKKAHNYDVIWVCHPELFEFIPKNYSGKIIYDCMDNHVAMSPKKDKTKIFQLEQDLITRADIIFSSSKRLSETIPNLQKAILVRNGFNTATPVDVKPAIIKEKYKIGYFGTISSWFDFELLKKGSTNSTVEYHLLGPVEKQIEDKLNDEKIVYEGIIEHSELKNKIIDYDALIMPFIVNDIILAVDPVKLYEYILFGKCIISVWYPEIDRFEPFVYFYKDVNEYKKLIQLLCEQGFPPKYNSFQQSHFLKKNTWECRYEIIKNEINNF